MARAVAGSMAALAAASAWAASTASAQSVDVEKPAAACPTSTREGTEEIRVLVRDDATSRPIPGARVRLAGGAVGGTASPDSGRRITADSTGRFRICGLSPSDTVSVSASRWSFSGPITTITSADVGTTVILPLDLGPPGRVTGTVVDGPSSEPLAGATVDLPELGVRSSTDADGRFVLDRVPALRFELRARHMGHATVRDSVRVRPASSLHVLVELRPNAVDVQPLEVTVRGVRPRWLEQAGFYRRRAENPGGRFVTGEELRERGLLRLSDWFRRLPGMRLNADGEPVTGRRTLSSATSGQCGVQYIVNGQPSLSGLDIDAFSPREIAALELYSGGAQLPPRFNVRRASACGVLVIWTRRQ